METTKETSLDAYTVNVTTTSFSCLTFGSRVGNILPDDTAITIHISRNDVLGNSKTYASILQQTRLETQIRLASLSGKDTTKCN